MGVAVSCCGGALFSARKIEMIRKNNWSTIILEKKIPDTGVPSFRTAALKIRQTYVYLYVKMEIQ